MDLDSFIPLEQIRADQEARRMRHEMRPAQIRWVIDGCWWARRTVRDAWSPRPWNRLWWRWQRSRRGWSDRDMWSLDRYLAGVIAGSLRCLRDTGHGYPIEMTEDEWEQTLTDIIEPLETYVADRFDPDESIYELGVRETEEYQNAVEAMHKLASVFGSLWD